MTAILALLLAQDFEPGKIRDGASTSGMTWHVRVPPGHDPKTPSPAIVFFHGSSMNSRVYLQGMTEAWPKLAEDYILIGLDGENRVKDSPDENPAYNYTYVNFVGKSKYKGFPGTDRESPARVAEAVEELKTKLRLSKIFVGGHSQGGFLSYSCYLNYPELFAGAFPISGGLIFQCEPTAYERPELRAQQRRGAVAIVHGENDGLVDFAAAAAALASFEDDAFPAVRLFSDKEAGHRFVFLPVEKAVRWLESMTADAPEALMELAERKIRAAEWRDASALLLRARERGAAAVRIDALQGEIDRAAAAGAKELVPALREAKDDAWVEGFRRFRSRFEFSAPAKEVLELHGKLRALHEKPAEELFFAARRELQAGMSDAAYLKLQEIVRSHFASSWYRHAKTALERRR